MFDCLLVVSRVFVFCQATSDYASVHGLRLDMLMYSTLPLSGVCVLMTVAIVLKSAPLRNPLRNPCVTFREIVCEKSSHDISEPSARLLH